MSPPNGSVRAGEPDEETALLGNNSSKKSTPNRLQKHMTANINKSWGDIALLGCYIITGLLDSSAVFIWGSFVSMQTGNTVYLGLGLVEPSAGQRWIKSLVSIASFCFGSFCFARYHQHLGPRKRWVLVLSFMVQFLCIVGAAVIVMFGAQTDEGLHWQVIVPLAIVAFQSAGQAVTSRVLQYNGLTSVVLTSNYCDLFSDPKLFTSSLKENVERNRRTAAPILLLAGAMLGGVFAHSEIGLAGALWTAAGLKMIAVIAWIFWAAEPQQDEE